MLDALDDFAPPGVWRVLYYSAIGAALVAVYAGAMRKAGVSWTAIRWSLIGLYVAVYVWWFFNNGIIIDRISVLWSFAIFLGVASIGRTWRQWLRTAGDLTLFVLMWLAYDESRGIADGLGMPIQVESVRNLDRWLFLGTDPVVWLQDRFLEPTVRWYDMVGSTVYYSHFIVPPVTIGVLWFANRHQWVRYMRRFATLLFVACAGFVLLPTAPPWMAAGGRNRVGLDLDVLPPLSRHTGRGWGSRGLGLDGFVEAWDHGRDWANQVAAMPSLHSAFALFVVVFFFPWIRDVRVPAFAIAGRRTPSIMIPGWSIKALMLLYPLTMAVALAYFAEHYFVDAFAGWAIVGASFWIWNRIERRLAARRLARTTGDRPDRHPDDPEGGDADRNADRDDDTRRTDDERAAVSPVGVR